MIVAGVEGPRARAALHATVHHAGGPFGRERARELFAREGWMPGRARSVLLAGGALDESPMAYRRLPEVSARHAGTIRVTHTRNPSAVAMASEGAFDPFTD